MNVTIARYALGVASLLIVVASMATVAIVLRRRFFPDWHGAPARLAESVIAFTTLFTTLELLGAIGLFRLAPIVAASLLTALGTATAVGGAADAHRCVARVRGRGSTGRLTATTT